MAKDETQVSETALTKDLVRARIKDGEAGVLIIDLSLLSRVVLPDDISIEQPALLDGNILLFQEDGSFVVLTNLPDSSILIESQKTNVPLPKLLAVATQESSWETASELPRIPLFFILNEGAPVAGSEFESALFVKDPLVGLPFNPLLPPTDFSFGNRKEERYGGDDGSPPVDFEIVVTGPLRIFETDDLTTLILSDNIEFVIGPENNGAFVTEVTLTLTNLPAIMATTEGQLIAQPDGTNTLEFQGTEAQFENLTLTFATDFSTGSRSDIASIPFLGSIKANTNFDVSAGRLIIARITPEGDVEIDDGLPDTVPDETDDVTPVTPSDLLLPAVTDADGSEA
ncbi:MAG: hypothetical protein ACU0AZ_13155, partial [Paracoccaceae bacterium]